MHFKFVSEKSCKGSVSSGNTSRPSCYMYHTSRGFFLESPLARTKSFSSLVFCIGGYTQAIYTPVLDLIGQVTCDGIALQSVRWLKLVSTLSREIVIRRINTTTLYHVTAMLWYHVKHQLSLNEIQSFL